MLPVFGAEHLSVRMLSLEGFIWSLFYCGCLFFPKHKYSSVLCSSKATLSDTQSAAQLIAFSPSGENAALPFISFFFLPRRVEGLFNKCYLRDFRIVKSSFFHFSVTAVHFIAAFLPDVFRQIFNALGKSFIPEIHHYYTIHSYGSLQLLEF